MLHLRVGVADLYPLIPTAAAFDSFWDFQIEETLTRCWLMREEQTSMGGAVAITRVDLTAAELRAAAGRGKDGSAARRVVALAMGLDGGGRKAAAQARGMDRPNPSGLGARFNA